MNKTEERLDRWCSGEGVDFVDTVAEAEYKKRARRVADAVQLKVPDQVPVELVFGMFPALSNGYTGEEILFDRQKAFDCYKKTILAMGADTFRLRLAQGHFLEAMDSKQVKLPGRGIPVGSNIQFVESECATAEEFYDAFIEDPSGYILRVHWPRIFGILEPLQQINPLSTAFSYYLGSGRSVVSFGASGVAEAFQKLCDVGKMVLEDAKYQRARSAEMLSLGFPADAGGGAHCPFDTIGDFIRGTKGIMLDMYRRPEKLLAAMDKLVPFLLDIGLQARKSLSPFVFIPLHKGIDSFMSLDQYKTFYWPPLKKVVLGLIEEGLVPILFFEGENTSRLEVIRDIPKGKAVYHFERIDLKRAKEILGDTVCFRGNVPVSLLNVGSPEEITAYVKALIDIVGKDGGLIVDCGSIFDEAKFENVKAMVDATREHGRYY